MGAVRLACQRHDSEAQSPERPPKYLATQIVTNGVAAKSAAGGAGRCGQAAFADPLGEAATG